MSPNTIGNGCLFAEGFDVTVSDMHSITDVETGRRINPPADIDIGQHVWLGQKKSMVLKEATIPPHSIVEECALVTGTYPGNAVIAGVPTRAIKTGVSWDRRLLPVED